MHAASFTRIWGSVGIEKAILPKIPATLTHWPCSWFFSLIDAIKSCRFDLKVKTFDVTVTNMCVCADIIATNK